MSSPVDQKDRMLRQHDINGIVADAIGGSINTVGVLQRSLRESGVLSGQEKISEYDMARLFLASIMPHPMRIRPTAVRELEQLTCGQSVEWPELKHDGPLAVFDEDTIVTIIAAFFDRYDDGIRIEHEQGRVSASLNVTLRGDRISASLDLDMFGKRGLFQFAPDVEVAPMSIEVTNMVSETSLCHVAHGFSSYRLSRVPDDFRYLMSLDADDWDRVIRGKDPIGNSSPSC